MLTIGLSGCELISVSEDISHDSDDRVLPATTLNRIELGVSKRAWIEAVLGKPDSAEDVKDTTILSYQFSESIAQRVRILLLFRYKGSYSRERILFVQLKDDVVQKVWLEGDDLREPIEFGKH